MKNFSELARAYALKNAISYNGKAQTGAVISSLFHEGLKKQDVKKIIKDIQKIVSEINKFSIKQQEKEFKKLKKIISKRKVREGLPELPSAKKNKVIMRFAPSASGPLHVGHALTASLSFLFVKKYGGKFYIRIEDTNPENIYKLAYKMIEQESKWLFKNSKFVKLAIQSDRIPIYYKYAEKLIEKNSAYVCTCEPEKFREFVKQKKNCPCRKNNSKENLIRWKKMLDKNGYKQGEAVLRFKSNMKNPNPAMRDFPLARINLTPHLIQKKKFRVWPLMNLSVAVDDIEMKMTHIIRAKDHRDNAKRQEMIYKILGKKIPWAGFLGRIHLKDFHLSTSQMRKAIQEKKYSGWDDKKLPTIASLKKQGFKPEVFWKLAERIGLNENDKILDKKELLLLLKDFNKN